uniref:Uncharacterized protein n=1 Tax=Oryza barthii TaxID=65489 RepID=A0A0D3H1Z2_9ORYZ
MESEVCWLLCAALAAAMACYYLTGTMRRRWRRLPPGPTPLPVIGNGWRRWAEKRYDKVFGIFDSPLGRRSTGKHADAGAGDFLDSLLDLMSAGTIARDDVTSIMYDLFGAGTDTIAITVEWAMAELLRNPSVIAKAHAEMNNVLAGKVKATKMEENDVEKLPYLQAVVKEVMRLHPAAPILVPHRAEEDGAEIGGYAVPKGSTVIFNVWAIMRDLVAWERPEEFMPERFLDMAEEVDFRGKDHKFMPFGTGRRLCLGLSMAKRVVPFILASLLHAFEWRLPAGVTAEALDLSEKFTTVNVHVLVTPIKAIPILASDQI